MIRTQLGGEVLQARETRAQRREPDVFRAGLARPQGRKHHQKRSAW